MNEHFEDARYYLLRALEHAKLGVEAELWLLGTRAGRSLGLVDDPESPRRRAE